MFLKTCSFFIVFAVLVGTTRATNYPFHKDVTMSQNQKETFDQFKRNVSPKLTEEFMKSDMNLLRFLRAKNFDLESAEEYMLSEAEWRYENKMDKIHDEDWSILESEIPMKVEGFDRLGRPILYIDMGEWDTRRLILSGRGDQILRWVYKNWEESRLQIEEQVKQGHNVTRWIALIDLKGTNLVTNLNAASIPIYATATTGYLQHFPNMAAEIIIINTPSIFEVVLSMVKAISPELRDQLTVFGSNEDEWKPVIRDLVDPKELRERYGGDKPDDNFL